MLTNLQLQKIHIAARQVGLIESPIRGDDGKVRYRLALFNVAGVESAKDLNQSEFEDVMELMEDMGFIDTLGGGYWRKKVAARRRSANPRMVRKIIELHKSQDRYELAGLCHRMSNHRTSDPDQLYPREAWNLIEALKVIVEREGRSVAPAMIEDEPPF